MQKEWQGCVKSVCTISEQANKSAIFRDLYYPPPIYLITFVRKLLHWFGCCSWSKQDVAPEATTKLYPFTFLFYSVPPPPSEPGDREGEFSLTCKSHSGWNSPSYPPTERESEFARLHADEEITDWEMKVLSFFTLIALLWQCSRAQQRGESIVCPVVALLEIFFSHCLRKLACRPPIYLPSNCANFPWREDRPVLFSF